MGSKGMRLKRRGIVIELALIIVGVIVTFIVAARFDALEFLAKVARQHENWELDEILTTSVFLALASGVFATRRWLELRKALSELRQLRGILPVCAACKKIRDDAGHWHQIEEYIRENSEAEFSHGVCPDCQLELYGEKFADE